MGAQGAPSSCITSPCPQHVASISQIPAPSFWCKPTCASKCFWPSVRHRQRFPIALISLTLIYFKILHRLKKKTPTYHQLFCRASSKSPSRWGEARADPCGSSSAPTLYLSIIHQETAQLPTQGDLTGHMPWSPCTSQCRDVGLWQGEEEHRAGRAQPHCHPARWGQPNTLQMLPFFFPSFPSKSPSRLKMGSSLEKLGNCSNLSGTSKALCNSGETSFPAPPQLCLPYGGESNT